MPVVTARAISRTIPVHTRAEDRVGDVLAVLDDLGIERAHYYGYSYGGMMGWALGTHAPERFVSMAIGGAHPYAVADAVWARLDRMRAYLSEGMESYVAWRESQIGPWPPDVSRTGAGERRPGTGGGADRRA